MLRKADHVVSIILIAASFFTIVAIASGFLLYASGDYSGVLMEQHMWIGVVTGSCMLVTASLFLLYRQTARFYSLYMAGLIATNAAVALASHLGGSLTHGEDYLTEYVPMLFARSGEDSTVPAKEMLLYRDVVVPVFEAKCISCHNESRAKGEFSMASFEMILKGGESGNKGIVAGIADSSEVYKRIVLPEYHEDRMPPEGKMPMTSSEVMLLRSWINKGADVKMKMADAAGDSTMSTALDQVLPELKKYKRKQQIAAARDEQLDRELQKIAFRLNVVIEKDTASDEGLYAVAMKFPPASLSGEQLAELAPYGNAFSKLSLVASGIGDDGLYQISKMLNVKSLYLQKTGITGNGLVHLRSMPNLEVLNVSYTKVDDKFALDLLKFPALREVYLFQTNTTPQVAKALQAHKPGLAVLMEEGPYW